MARAAGYGSKATTDRSPAIVAALAPQDVSIEAFLGGGAILKRTPPTLRSLGLDANHRAIETFHCAPPPPVELHQGCALRVLETFGFPGRERVSCDPPYVPLLSGYSTVRREVPYGHRSRIDRLLEHPGRRNCYVESKNVHLSRQPGMTEVPDSVTERGRKPLGGLAKRAAVGDRAATLYLVQREDRTTFRLAGDLDPAYAAAFRAARAAVVEVPASGCRLSPDASTVADPLTMAAPAERTS